MRAESLHNSAALDFNNTISGEILNSISSEGFVALDDSNKHYKQIKEYLAFKSTVIDDKRVARVEFTKEMPRINNMSESSFLSKVNVWLQDKPITENTKPNDMSEFLSCVVIDDASSTGNYAGFIDANKALPMIHSWCDFFFKTTAYGKIINKYHLDADYSKALFLSVIETGFIINPKTKDKSFYLCKISFHENSIPLHRAWREIYQFMLRYCASGLDQILCQCDPGKIIIWDNSRVFYRILNGIKSNTCYTHIVGIAA